MAPLLLAAALIADSPPQTLPAPPVSSVEAEQPDILVRGSTRVPGDPLSAVNEKSFAMTASIDNAVGGPVARAYKRVVPNPVRSGIRNFFNNLHEPVVFVNFLLQHKMGKAAETVGRFALNSTIGVGGLGDVAKTKPFRLPRRQNGFADTLGFYGVKTGPFFYLPLLGPTTVRDLTGGIIDRLMVPMPIKLLSSPAVRLPTGAVRALDHRAEIDDRIRTLRNTPESNYDAAREFYLKRRQAEIDQLRGTPTAPDPEPASGDTPNGTSTPIIR